MVGTSIRTRRVVDSRSERSVVVPLDHPLSMGMIDGLEDMLRVVETVRDHGGTAVVLHKGSLMRLTQRGGAWLFDGLGIIVHLTGATSMSPDPARQVQVTEVDEAVELGADWVSVQVNFGNRAESDMAATLGRVSRQAHRRGVPVLAMAYVRDDAGVTNWDPNAILHAARAAEELGADAVKLPLIPAAVLAQATRVLSIPVWVAGGGKRNPDELLTAVEGCLRAGAGGVCIGRNFFQAADPARMLTRLSSLVHGREHARRLAIPA